MRQAGFAFASAPVREPLGPGAVVLRAFALAEATALLEDVALVAAAAPFRHMTVPGGGRMSAAMTNCGAFGWISDTAGYRYAAVDPASGLPWPAMPARFLALAAAAAAAGGFGAFEPDSCLVNRYEAGARMGLHQDRDEADPGQPIVSVSLGLPAVFLFGGARRRDATQAVPLEHGDVVVWGGESRSWFHGVRPVREGQHAVAGPYRFNLTLRRAR